MSTPVANLKRRFARQPSAENQTVISAPPELVDVAEKRHTKSSQFVDLLKRVEGATLEELVSATNWLPHTARAALTGLRKKGHDITKGKRGEVTCYFIAGARS